MKPKASIIITAYDEPAAVLLRSIKSALNQTISDIEVIVVIDNPTREMRPIESEISDKRVEFIYHSENKGGSAARNTGGFRARGSYLSFLDCDDEYTPGKVEKQIDYLKNSDDDLVGCYCEIEPIRHGKMKWMRRFLTGVLRSSNGGQNPEQCTRSKEGGEELIPRLLTSDLSIGATSTFLVKKNVFEEIDGFDESFPRHQDWEFMIRLLQSGKVGHVKEKLVRKHETSLPSADSVLEAKKIYLEKFEDEIRQSRIDMWDMYHLHQHQLGRSFVQNGDLISGISHIDFGMLSRFDYLYLAYKYSQHIYHKAIQGSQ